VVGSVILWAWKWFRKTVELLPKINAALCYHEYPHRGKHACRCCPFYTYRSTTFHQLPSSQLGATLRPTLSIPVALFSLN